MELSASRRPRNRPAATTYSGKASTSRSVKDLELHCQQLQALLEQLRSEKEFVDKENQQLRDAMDHPEAEEARSAKISVWLDLDRTCQAEVQLCESDDIATVASAVSRAHKLNAAEGRALQQQLQRSYLAMRTASAWSAASARRSDGREPRAKNGSGWASFDEPAAGAGSASSSGANHGQPRTAPSGRAVPGSQGGQSKSVALQEAPWAGGGGGEAEGAFAQSAAFDAAFDAFDPDAAEAVSPKAGGIRASFGATFGAPAASSAASGNGWASFAPADEASSEQQQQAQQQQAQQQQAQQQLAAQLLGAVSSASLPPASHFGAGGYAEGAGHPSPPASSFAPDNLATPSFHQSALGNLATPPLQQSVLLPPGVLPEATSLDVWNADPYSSLSRRLHVFDS